MMSIPSARVGASPGWQKPAWVWLMMGLLCAAGLSGGAYWFFDMGMPLQPTYTAAQQDSIKQHVFDDLPGHVAEVDLDRATNPTDLPPELQKTFDNSALSASHRAAMAKVFAPLPKPGGEIVDTRRAPTFADDFSDASSGWRVPTDANAEREYANGRLQITFTGAEGSAQSMSGKVAGNFAVQIEATPVSGQPTLWYGLTLRQLATDTYIVFLINAQGKYTVSTRTHGQSTTLAEPFKARAIKPGLATNFLKVYAVDEYFVFEVNGQVLDARAIEGFAPGGVGVIVQRQLNAVPDPASVAFGNFKLWVVK